LEEVVSDDERTRKIQAHNSITDVDHEKNKDCRSSPEEFVDSEVGKEEEVTRKSPKIRGREGSWPTVVTHGHIKGGY
jgi:hypothetical protein